MAVTIATGTYVDIPISSVIWYAAKVNPDSADHVNVPNGYLYCDGKWLNQSGVYNALFNKIGLIYTDITSDKYKENINFQIPDLRGFFIRGYDNRDGIGQPRVDKQIKTTFQNGEVKSTSSVENHTHKISKLVNELVGDVDAHNHMITFGTTKAKYNESGDITVLTPTIGMSLVNKYTVNAGQLKSTIDLSDISDKIQADKGGTGLETAPVYTTLIPIIKY